MAYFTTSYSFDATSTSSLPMLVWRMLSQHLLHHQKPMTGEELAEAVGVDVERIEQLFATEYYQKYYGFRRFETMEEFEAWAREGDILFDPEKHLVELEEEGGEQGESGARAGQAAEA